MIAVQDLYLRYPSAKKDTLQGITFTVQEGEIFGFLGPSGAGKSTLQKVLTGVLRAYRGSAKVSAMEMKNRSSDYYERIGVDFEFPNFYGKFTAMENLRYFASLYRHPIQDLMPLFERVGLAADADKKVASYSKGMKMRLGFIRSLMHSPDILFLDEPTSGLDPANARTLKEMVKEQQAQGKTILLTTHNMHDAEELCDRVAFIVDGKIAALDAPAAFKNTNGTVVEFSYSKNDAPREDIVTQSCPLAALGENSSFQSALREGRLTGIHSKERTLEDVFIELTGKGLQ
jgi:fluoroquinolone transport system ATP-binding protein